MGTLAYIAPEILENKSYTKEVDIYSFGIMLAELFTGAIRFGPDCEVVNDVSLSTRKLNDTNLVPCMKIRTTGVELIPPLCALIEECVRRQPIERPTMSQILEKLTRMRDLNIFGDQRKRQQRGSNSSGYR